MYKTGSRYDGIRLDPVTGTLIRDGVPSIMNPDDKAGLEMALELKDQYGAHVTVITMGPPQADAILREAFAMGADRAIHLSDRKFAGADTLATSNAIAGALRMLEFDLVITGRQAIDGDTAQVGPQIAEHLGLPQVTYLEGIKYEGGNRLVVKKWTEEGYQLLEVETPCVVTVLSSANRPRYMSVRGIVEAYDKQWKSGVSTTSPSKSRNSASTVRRPASSNPSRRVRNPQVRSSSWSRPKQPI
mgnify:CR=1 FL=1